MKQMIGFSRNGDLEEAIRSVVNPGLLIMIVSDKEKFEENVKALEAKYPGVPSIACVGQSYSQYDVVENGVTVTGFSGNMEAVCSVLCQVSTVPVKYIKNIENSVQKINANSDNTVCIDFCSSNDECVLTTLNSVLRKYKIQLTGGTAWEGLVAVNGSVYEDACAFALVKNKDGRVKVYKENLYTPTEKKHIATKTDPSKNIIQELDGRPCETVYTQELNITPDKISKQTFTNPFGRCIGDEVYIVSIKDRLPDKSLCFFRKVQQKDVLNILEIGDHKKIVQNTIDTIGRDFNHISGVFSINCLFRYLYFTDKKFVDDYFRMMGSIGTHSGLIGLGEHYNQFHTNQTMSCVVFE